MARLQKGFTISELLIAVAVASIASVLMVSAFVYTYGYVIVEQTKARMVSDSQLFLRRMVEDIRLSNEIRTKNSLPDPYNVGPGDGGSEGWVTSDPANILIATFPAYNSAGDPLYDDITGEPYYHEIVYHGIDDIMYRRFLANPDATDAVQTSTCPITETNCRQDRELVESLDNMLFEFYDQDDAITSIPENARSVEIIVNLRKQVYGRELTTTNSTRITLRND